MVWWASGPSLLLVSDIGGGVMMGFSRLK